MPSDVHLSVVFVVKVFVLTCVINQLMMLSDMYMYDCVRLALCDWFLVIKKQAFTGQ